MKAAAEPALSPRAALWARVAGTFFGIGHLRPGPGTWASLVTVGMWAGIGRSLPQEFRAGVAAALAAAVALIGIPAGTRLAHSTGKEDPSEVVIDEVAGQMLALIGAPLNWKSLLVGLILFRAFDIVKPPPLRRLETLPGGTGIMLDDVGAGLYALVVMQVLLHYGLLK